jgi:hypothetical protein
MMNQHGFARKRPQPNRGTMPALSGGTVRKPVLGWVAGVPAKIRTKRVPHIIPERYNQAACRVTFAVF